MSVYWPVARPRIRVSKSFINGPDESVGKKDDSMGCLFHGWDSESELRVTVTQADIKSQ